MKNEPETGARFVKRYSLTMDGRRWEQLTRRAKALNTSNTALINQLVEVFLNGPTALPAMGTAAANPLSSEAGMNMIGATYTDILNRLTTISRKVEEIRSDTALTNDILQDDGGKVEQISRDVATMAAAFRRSKQGQPKQETIQRARPAEQERRSPFPPPRPGGLTITKEIGPNEAISAFVPIPNAAPTSQESETSKRERLNRLAEATAASGVFMREFPDYEYSGN